ncbi:hypothetical protein BDZ45DRAFT_736224 [Acephala macrosclerotiorum]|nr:hypothetical protein BDZ45DRAFT_736224 [Acephala macrosclerotiorum]
MPDLDTPFIQVLLRTVQITFAVAGIILLAFLLKDPDAFGSFYGGSQTLFTTLFMNFLLAAFSFGVISSLIFIALIMREGLLGAKQALIAFVLDLVVLAIWIGAGVPLILQANQKGCMKSYAGLCLDIMLIVAFTLAELVLQVILFMLGVKGMAGQ